MDRLSLFGILTAFVAIYFGFIIDGGSVYALFELPAFIIVLGGTLGAVMLQSSKQQFFHAISLLKWILFTPKCDVEQGVESIVSWSIRAREHGFLSIEDIAQEQSDPFIKKGLNLLVDGVDVEQLSEALALEIDLFREYHLRSAKVFESMGGYSPTMGILGAVLGLIHAMSHLSDPQLLGQGIATAFVATIYGVGFANLIFLPVANKINNIVYQQTLYKEMLAEGIRSIALAQNPKAIENRLLTYRLVV